MKFFLCVFFIFIQTALTLNCTNVTVDPIVPIGCTIINGDLDLATSEHIQEELLKFTNITEINGHLKFSWRSYFGQTGYDINNPYLHNPNLNSFEGFHSLHTITGYLEITSSPVIENLHGLYSLVNIGGAFTVQNNANLTSLDGLYSLESIGGRLFVGGNPVNCTNVCNQKVVNYWASLASSITRADCQTLNFECNVADPVLEGIDECIPDSECTICNQSSCNFERRIFTGCGNGILEDQEQCDPGSPVPPCEYGTMECQECTSACSIVDIVGRYCGNGIVEADEGEGCDTSGIQNQCPYDQTCEVCDASTCMMANLRTKYCGDGIISREEEEECDTLLNQTECPYGEQTCQICDSTCRVAVGIGSYCGDNVTDGQNGEQCDPGSVNQTQCEYNIKNCELCSPSCSIFFATGGYCGDGIVDKENEVCDGNTTNSVCNSNCSVVTDLVDPSSTTADVVASTESSSENTASSSECKELNIFVLKKDNDCEYVACTIENKNDIKVYKIENLDMDKDVVLSNSEEFIITSGNLTLNKYKLTLSSTSRIKIEGCLDGSNSSLFLDLTDVKVNPKPQTFKFIEFECIVGEFGSIESSSPDGVCGSIQNVYAEDHYSAVITTDYCVGASFKLDIYYSFYVVMVVLAMVF